MRRRKFLVWLSKVLGGYFGLAAVGSVPHLLRINTVRLGEARAQSAPDPCICEGSDFCPCEADEPCVCEGGDLAVCPSDGHAEACVPDVCNVQDGCTGDATVRVCRVSDVCDLDRSGDCRVDRCVSDSSGACVGDRCIADGSGDCTDDGGPGNCGCTDDACAADGCGDDLGGCADDLCAGDYAGCVGDGCLYDACHEDVTGCSAEFSNCCVSDKSGACDHDACISDSSGGCSTDICTSDSSGSCRTDSCRSDSSKACVNDGCRTDSSGACQRDYCTADSSGSGKSDGCVADSSGGCQGDQCVADSSGACVGDWGVSDKSGSCLTDQCVSDSSGSCRPDYCVSDSSGACGTDHCSSDSSNACSGDTCTSDKSGACVVDSCIADSSGDANNDRCRADSSGACVVSDVCVQDKSGTCDTDLCRDDKGGDCATRDVCATDTTPPKAADASRALRWLYRLSIVLLMLNLAAPGDGLAAMVIDARDAVFSPDPSFQAGQALSVPGPVGPFIRDCDADGFEEADTNGDGQCAGDPELRDYNADGSRELPPGTPFSGSFQFTCVGMSSDVALVTTGPVTLYSAGDAGMYGAVFAGGDFTLAALGNVDLHTSAWMGSGGLTFRTALAGEVDQGTGSFSGTELPGLSYGGLCGAIVQPGAAVDIPTMNGWGWLLLSTALILVVVTLRPGRRQA